MGWDRIIFIVQLTMGFVYFVLNMEAKSYLFDPDL